MRNGVMPGVRAEFGVDADPEAHEIPLLDCAVTHFGRGEMPSDAL